MSKLNAVVEKLMDINNSERRTHIRQSSIDATLTTETKDFLIAQGKLDATIDNGKFGFTNGNCELQNASNEKVLAGTPLSEQ